MKQLKLFEDVNEKEIQLRERLATTLIPNSACGEAMNRVKPEGGSCWAATQVKVLSGAERAQVRKATGIMRHLLLALRAFLRLEVYRLKTGISWYKAKLSIIRDAVRTYLAHPIYVLPSTA